eukprot:Tamp_15114.p1 GENE.Tamp_15114~~Tamp_15114.p1  ORF type:complete len:168 (-),score=33.85 Tamp_15114:562-1065(-)
MRLRHEPSRHCRHIFNVQVPADQQVAVFLCRCRDGVRSAVEQRLASLRGAAASSLGLDEYQLNKKFAVNCTDARVQQLRAVAVVGAGHAPWDEIPAGAGIVPVMAGSPRAEEATLAEPSDSAIQPLLPRAGEMVELGGSGRESRPTSEHTRQLGSLDARELALQWQA